MRSEKVSKIRKQRSRSCAPHRTLPFRIFRVSFARCTAGVAFLRTFWRAARSADASLTGLSPEAASFHTHPTDPDPTRLSSFL